MTALTLSEVQNFVVQCGLIPNFKEYKNVHTKISVICPKHGEFITTYNNLKKAFDYKKGNGCKECRRELQSKNKKLPIEQVYKVIRALGLNPLFTEYNGCKEEIQCECPKHGVFTTKFMILQKCYRDKRGNGCKKCLYEKNANKKRLTLKQAQDIIIKLGHIPLFDEYINNDTPVLVKCKKHGEFKITIGDAKKKLKNKNGNGCRACRDEKRRKYSKPEQEKRRKGIEYSNWRKGVYKRDKYSCRKCGCNSNKENKLNAHHITNYASDSKNRFNIDNGITLCFNCHKEFHKKYGYTNNNKEQIIEFINGEL